MISARSAASCLSPPRALGPQLHAPTVARQWRRSGIRCSASTATDSPSALLKDTRHTLPGGMELEVLHCGPQTQVIRHLRRGSSFKIYTLVAQAKNTPLLFLHGSGHGAWCWSEKFSPHFAQQGRESWAISFRGQGTGSPPEKGASPGTLVSHAADLAHFAATLLEPPVMVCHSLGGLVLQKYLQTMESEGWLRPAGVAFLAAGPPSGSKETVKRIFKSSPLRGLKITWGFITKSYLRSADSARYLFFSDKLPEDELHRYHDRLVALPGCSMMDVSKIKEEMPIQLPPHNQLPPSYVAGAVSDIIVDAQAVQELAEAMGTEARVFEGGHDMMLDTHWEDIADSLEQWVATIDSDSDSDQLTA